MENINGESSIIVTSIYPFKRRKDRMDDNLVVG